MKLLVAVVFYLVYWGICYLATGTDKKNLIGLRSYPEEVQECVRKHSQEIGPIPKAKPVMEILLSNLLMFTIAFSILGLALRGVLGLEGYWPTFWYFLALGEGLGVFDLLVIDLLWWRGTKRIRFSFLPEKSRYQNLDKHVQSFVRGIPLFAAVAALTTGGVTLL